MTRTITRAITASEIETGRLEITGNTGVAAGKLLDVRIGEVRVRDIEGGGFLAVNDGSRLTGEIEEWLRARSVAAGAQVRMSLEETRADGEGAANILEVIPQPIGSSTEAEPPVPGKSREHRSGQPTGTPAPPDKRDRPP